MHSSKADELHDLQPLFEKGLWIFGPEYEAVDFRSNRGMAHVIKKFLNIEEEVAVTKRRMDFIVLPDATIGIYGADAYAPDGEVSGLRKVMILELKKGGFDLTQKELDQGRDYAKELRLTGAVHQETDLVVYVLGATLEPGLERSTHGAHTSVDPMTYDVVLNRVRARTFNLQKKLQLIADSLPKDEEVEAVMADDISEQDDLAFMVEPVPPHARPSHKTERLTQRSFSFAGIKLLARLCRLAGGLLHFQSCVRISVHHIREPRSILFFGCGLASGDCGSRQRLALGECAVERFGKMMRGDIADGPE